MKQHFGTFSTVILCSSAILSKYLIVVPEYLVKNTGNCAWLVIIVKALIALISFLIMLFLYKPFFPLPLDEVFEHAFGKPVKIIFNYVYVISFTVLNSFLLRLLIEALGTVMAPEAPNEYFALFILSAVFVGAIYGIRSIANLSILIFPFVIITLIFICSALTPHYRLNNLMPIFGKGQNQILTALFKNHYGFFEIIILFFYSSYLSDYKAFKRCGILTLSIVAVFTTFFTTSYCLSIPFPASEKFVLPLYQMTRMIKASSFLQRLEPVSIFVWTSFILCSLSTLISLSSKLLSSDKTNETAFVPILVIITFFISMLPKNESTVNLIYKKLLTFGSNLFPLIPVLLLLFARIRRIRNAEM